MNKEIIGIIGNVATLLVLASMCFKTTSYKGSMCMRVLNIIGSAVFVIYGIMLPAISTAILNSALIVVNSYHTVILIKNHKKDVSKTEMKENN